MQTCISCGSELNGNDRFCRECGAENAGADARPLTLLIPAPAPSGAARAREARRRNKRSKIAFGLLLASLVLLGVMLAAIGYLVLAGRESPGAATRFALDYATEAVADPEPEPSPAPEPAETPATAEDEGEEAAEPADDTPDNSAPPRQDSRIEPGRWAFTTELVNVTKVDPSDMSFRLSRQGIGSREASSQCVSRAVAGSPGSSAFPLGAVLGCRANSFAMADNRYSARMTCNLPQYGGPRPVDVQGQYSDTGIALDLRIRVPAAVVVGEFETPPQIYMHYRMTGQHSGECQ